MQTNLENIEWDEKNEVGNNTVDEWIKLNIGDVLIGVYTDKYEDGTYNKMKYFFSNATIIRSDGKKQKYDKVGLNSSGNLDFKINNNEILGTPLKIMRTQDKPIEGKPNPAHQFVVYQPKNK